MVGAAGVLAVWIVPASGAAKPVPPGATLVKCKALITTEIPGGQTQELPGAASGKQWGLAHCAKPLGIGVQKNAFAVDQNSGEMKGSFRAYLATGTIFGKFKMVPQEGSLSNPGLSATFASVSYMGTIKVVSGTGAWAGANGTGTTTCNASDGLHFTCINKLILTKL